ncbi:hypothetical protein ACNS7O_15495 (plasmid) [Haloferacaceae archaeon DSL9]
MALSTSQEEVLDEIIEKVPDEATWCLIGSTDSVLRGLIDDPSDIDILATESAAIQFREVFPNGFIETREIGRSQIDTYGLNGEELEVIFDQSSKSRQKPLLDLECIEFESDNERGVPLLPLKHLISVYEQIDKHETVERLKAEFDPPLG